MVTCNICGTNLQKISKVHINSKFHKDCLKQLILKKIKVLTQSLYSEIQKKGFNLFRAKPSIKYCYSFRDVLNYTDRYKANLIKIYLIDENKPRTEYELISLKNKYKSSCFFTIGAKKLLNDNINNSNLGLEYVKDLLPSLYFSKHKKDGMLLELLFFFLYSFPNKSYLFKGDSLELKNRKNKYIKSLYALGRQNLHSKYNVQEKDINLCFEKIRKFIDYILNEYIIERNEGRYSGYYGILEEVNVIKKKLLLSLNEKENQFENISELEKKVLFFIINIISTITKTEDRRDIYWNDGRYNVYEIKSLGIKFNSAHDDSKTGIILINFSLLNGTFNNLFKKDLNTFEQELIVEKTKFTFWKMGEILLKLGVGFWLFSLTTTGNINRDKKNFMIPEIYYERIKKSSKYKKIENTFVKQGFSFRIDASEDTWAFLKNKNSIVEEFKLLEQRESNCPSCSKKVEEDAIYCKFCGSGINITSRHISDDVKREVWKRDKEQCIKCGRKVNLEFDHIIPFSKGGSNTTKNIQLLCSECNSRKYNKIGG